MLNCCVQNAEPEVAPAHRRHTSYAVASVAQPTVSAPMILLFNTEASRALSFLPRAQV